MTTTTTNVDPRKPRHQEVVARYAKPDNLKGLTQVLVTLVPLALLWWAAVLGYRISWWLAAATVPLIALFTLRVFALMHDCGHFCLLRGRWLNRAIGFGLGVLAGMPQYVWSQHHGFHHAHNGNWQRYRGPYTTLSVGEYAALSPAQRRWYRRKCAATTAPLAGFIYLVFNPRYTWLRGSLGLIVHVVRGKLASPRTPMKELAASYETRYWKSAREYWHMFWNNVVLLSLWAVMCWACGTGLFFSVYVPSVSLAGGAGIVLFTVQHNFKHSYASDDDHWDYYAGCMAGTSFLILPRWLNWFTVDIAYHHVHHLSANIPNYRLAQCHRDNRQLFESVTRVKLSEVLDALKFILWDTRAQRIISVAEYQQQAVATS